MIKTDIISGFLGAGKTTLIKKLIADVYSKRGEKIVIIENEFGKVGIDGGFLRDAGIQITEMNSGCICCSLVGDFGKALKKVVDEYSPDRIIIEPSGVGKLSDVAEAINNAGVPELHLNCMTAVIDAVKCKMYLRNFEEFYRNQLKHATAIVLSRTAGIRQDKLEEAIAIIREINPTASLVTTAWDEIDGEKLLSAMENTDTAAAELEKLISEHKDEHHHHHHHHGEECDDPDCHCHDHDDDDDDDDDECDDPECECHHHDGEHHHHHHHGEECDDPDCHCHDHDDDDDDDDDECDDPDCECHHHHGHHHHGHHADEVFSSVGFETPKAFTEAFVSECLDALDTGKYGVVLRAKGILPCADGGWLNFDYVPGEKNIRSGSADITGKLCIIGSGIDKELLSALFNL